MHVQAQQVHVLSFPFLKLMTALYTYWSMLYLKLLMSMYIAYRSI